MRSGPCETERMDVSGAELVRPAQAGDVAALGTLLAGHRPAMLAVALSILPESADAEDAVQDATLTALSRIGDLRDPEAVGPWLKMIVRNCCRMRLRVNDPMPLTENRHFPTGGTSRAPWGGGTFIDDPALLVERHAARDWIWHALGQLSEPLRVVVLLRYFTRTTGYEEIAALCGIPVGTVRSRLSKARRVLAGRLSATAESWSEGPDREVLSRYRHLFGELTGGGRSAGDLNRGLHPEMHPELETVWVGKPRTVGVAPITSLLARSAEAGVALHVVTLVASRDIVVCETEAQNPVEHPDHCPPTVAWLLRLDGGGRASSLGLLHEDRSAA
jgi:RNA polymerase sigma factor (sigma-70 family)